MESLVVYDSKFGNTKKLAEVMAEALQARGPVRLVGLDKVMPQNLGTVDLLIIGGPTQAHGMSGRIRQFLDALDTRSATGMVAATFDTRYRMPAIVSGSAAKAITKALRRTRVLMIVPPESFFVTRGDPQLEDGEAQRAAAWARSVAHRCELSGWCAA